MARIREGEPAANPIEKTILWRILYFWTLNIQLVFITDGLRKPGKKRWGKKTGGGRGGSKVDKDAIKMLHKMFDRLHVPYHEAPGEAEAECACMQQLDVVDAVWSDDGDCLMFGCTTLIKAHRNASGKKDWGRIQLYRAEEVLPQFDFDTDSLVLFAVLAGGDYDDKGLPGCGPQTAKVLSRRETGLAKTLRGCENKQDLAAWRDELSMVLREKNYASDIPREFPDLKALNGYRNAAVSTDEKCRNIRRLHTYDGGWEWWESQMDQTKLRVVLRDHYNFNTRVFLKHLAPVFLTRALTRSVNAARREENLSYGVTLRRTQNRKNKDGEDIGQPSEVNIKFDASRLVQINLSVQPPEEDWSSTVKNDGVRYDPTKLIDGEMLSCFLSHGLPEGALDKPTASPKKSGRKSGGTDLVDDDVDLPAASQRYTAQTSSSKPKASPKSSHADLEASQHEPKESQLKNTKKRKARSEDAEGSSKPKKSRKAKTAEGTPSPDPPAATFRRLAIPSLVTKRSTETSEKAMPTKHFVIDLDDSDSEPAAAPATMPRTHAQHQRIKDAKGSHSAMTTTKPKQPPEASGMRSHKPVKTQLTPSLPASSTSDTTSTPQGSATQLSARRSAPSPLPASFLAPASSLEQLGLPSSPPADLDLNITPSAETLRRRRERGLLSKLSQPKAQAESTVPATIDRVPNPPVAQPISQHEVIDLT